MIGPPLYSLVSALLLGVGPVECVLKTVSTTQYTENTVSTV